MSHICSHHQGASKSTMDAIKKKMQAMKVEKDNAMDRSDVCEQAAKDAKVKNKSPPILKQITNRKTESSKNGFPTTLFRFVLLRLRRRLPSW